MNRAVVEETGESMRGENLWKKERPLVLKRFLPTVPNDNR